MEKDKFREQVGALGVFKAYFQEQRNQICSLFLFMNNFAICDIGLVFNDWK